MINTVTLLFLFLSYHFDVVKSQTLCEMEVNAILTDSVLSKQDNLLIQYEILNTGQENFYLYPNYVNLELVSNGVRSIPDCYLNDREEKLFLHIRRTKKVKTKILRGKKYISNELEIDLSHVCWEKDINKLVNFEVVFSYYDFNSKKIFYSLPKSVKIKN